MGHYQKLSPPRLRLIETQATELHIFNGGFRHRHTRLYKEVRVPIKIIDRPLKWSPYDVVDGVLRRDPRTLPKWQRSQGTVWADMRRERRQLKGLADESRQKAHRSRQAGGGTWMGVDRSGMAWHGTLG